VWVQITPASPDGDASDDLKAEKAAMRPVAKSLRLIYKNRTTLKGNAPKAMLDPALLCYSLPLLTPLQKPLLQHHTPVEQCIF